MSIKGQTFSIDFLIAGSLFLVVVTILFYYWTFTSLQLEEARKLDKMTEKAYLLSNVWFREGTPKYWNPSDVVDLGLQNGHVFNQTKLNALADIGYEKVGEMTGTTEYDFYLSIQDNQNNTLFSFGEYPLGAEDVIKVRRAGLLNRSVVFVDTLLWK